MCLDRDEVTGGKIDMPVYYRGFRVGRFEYPICNATVGGCPIRKGKVQMVMAGQLPSNAFSGNYTVSTFWKFRNNV